MDHIPYQIEGEDRPGRWLITCDHATNHVPDFVGGGSLAATSPMTSAPPG
jgi:predicted N-formylglutamate amidohydrolase